MAARVDKGLGGLQLGSRSLAQLATRDSHSEVKLSARVADGTALDVGTQPHGGSSGHGPRRASKLGAAGSFDRGQAGNCGIGQHEGRRPRTRFLQSDAAEAGRERSAASFGNRCRTLQLLCSSFWQSRRMCLVSKDPVKSNGWFPGSDNHAGGSQAYCVVEVKASVKGEGAG